VRDVADDSRVGQLGEHPRLAREATALVVGARREELQRHLAPGVAIDGAEHRRHPARRGDAAHLEPPCDD
jgi:hypothetical protein